MQRMLLECINRTGYALLPKNKRATIGPWIRPIRFVIEDDIVHSASMVPDQDLAAFQYLVCSPPDWRVRRGDAAGADWKSGVAGPHFLLRTGDLSGHPITSDKANQILRETADLGLSLDYRGRLPGAAG
jgi:hypothetical protein